MDMNDYQTMAARTAQYPHAGQGDIVALSYLGLGLGEAGEVQGKIKKILRDDNGEVRDEHRVAILKELGDLLWYVAMVAEELDVSLNRVAEHNLRKLDDRLQRGVIAGSGDDR